MIIYVIDSANLSIVSTQGIAKLYDLTPAEDAVCNLLVKGMTTNEIAAARSVKVETVRSQIKTLLDKIRVNTRIHLIKCLSVLPWAQFLNITGTVKLHVGLIHG